MTEQLQIKINRAIKLIQSASKIAKENGCNAIQVSYSGGKDSDVILELTKMANVPYRAIYKNTTIDPPGTIAHVKTKGVEILQPKESFFELVSKAGFPNRFARFCCNYLKEYKVLDYSIIGIRREESVKRAKRYKEPEECRVYSKNKKEKLYYPILDWTNKDIVEFIKERNIKCAPIYYDGNGNFHVERRLGCMCCPLQGRKQRIENFLKYPNMVKAYIRHGQSYLLKHQDSKIFKRFNGNVFAWFVKDVFYPGDTQGWKDLNSGFLPPPRF